jgi:hypothetical protein
MHIICTLSPGPLVSLSGLYPLRHRSGEPSPPRCSDVSFIVKHLPCAVDPETALHGKPYAPTQGGWTRESPATRARPTMKPQRMSMISLEK